MKKSTILALFMLFAMAVTAQETVTWRFTSTTPSGSYYPFDVVNVTNVTRGWTESLTYPDTTMVLSTLTGLDENFDNGGFLSEVYPNPLSGTANVMFGMKQPGIINAKVLSINGSVLSEYNDFLEAGLHQITFNLNEPQMAFLVVKTNDNQYVKKILNISYGNDNSIAINKIADEIKYTKERTIGDFEIGDVMSYIAVSFVNGNMVESERITQAQYDNDIITLIFNINPNPVLPTVITYSVSNITLSTATCGGNVTSSGNGTVTARGVCWNTSSNPTISDSHTTDGSGTGSFTSSITGLNTNTTYYVRAYATNEAGTKYGEQKSFTTIFQQTIPTVITSVVTNITRHTALAGGNVTSDGGANIIERGVCWSTNPNPTASGNHITASTTGTGNFTCQLNGLEPATTYYLKAYAINSQGPSYGDVEVFTTEELPQGIINGLFAVNDSSQVYFSQGNLQYRASTNTWRFATNQWDYVGGTANGIQYGTVSGSSNNNISPTYSGWIDLFGWGTSGYNHGATCYQPWDTIMSYSYYWAYGGAFNSLYDETGMADWGYNAISNGGNQENYGWRTLTQNEWEYIINTRNTPSGIRYTKANVNNINGLIILPDNWSNDYYNFNNINSSSSSFNDNVITGSQWYLLEQYGAVFLPGAGGRTGTQLIAVPTGYGIYWLATKCSGDYAYIIWFNDEVCSATDSDPKSFGRSVRLVHH